jgi:acetoin utilization deacetylase AcuC-like enzyme/GNAT superfamily N-acetyltransferase
MIRIRRLYDDVLSIDQQVIAQVQEILRQQFPSITEREVGLMPGKMRDPLKAKFRSILFVADDLGGKVRAFALLLHAPDLNFCYLDYISTARHETGGGLGGALYDRLRKEALSLGSVGLFFECLPDDQALCPDPETRKQNAARLRFYERYGARPIANTAYETPVEPDDDCPPLLVYDGLGEDRPLRKEPAQAIVRAILARKYGHYCPRSYVEKVVSSFKDDPVRLREPRYVKKKPAGEVTPTVPADQKIMLLVNDKHNIHYVRERGYVESPVRVRTILREFERTDLFAPIKVKHFSEDHIRKVHDPKYVDYFQRVCANLKPGKSIYPYVFPIRNAARPPIELAVRAGYYCIDTFTPINQNAYLAAKRAVDCTLTGASQILAGTRLVYALVRPPGHHAERRAFGGFCYFNSNAIAAQHLSAHGPVAILDIDYHHGNGQQDIFYRRPDVLTLSIHGHPRFAYPYFSGFKEERGEGEGQGFNVNIPLPEQIDFEGYRKALNSALRRIRQFRPKFLVVALGLDTAKNDPTGTWPLLAREFEQIGNMVGALRLHTLVVQEGGYNNRSLGVNARRFFTGLWSGAFSDVPSGGRAMPASSILPGLAR